MWKVLVLLLFKELKTVRAFTLELKRSDSEYSWIWRAFFIFLQINYIHGVESFRSQRFLSQSRNSPSFMDSEGVPPRSQQPAILPFNELDQSIPVPHRISYKIHFNIILPSTSTSYTLSLSFRFPHQSPVCTPPVPHTCQAPLSFNYFLCLCGWLSHCKPIFWILQDVLCIKLRAKEVKNTKKSQSLRNTPAISFAHYYMT